MDRLASSLAFRLGAAYRRVDRLLNRAFAPVGLTSAHGQVLAHLLFGEARRVTDLARLTGFEPSTVSRLVKELARRRLVRRKKHPEDARALLLTPGARAEDLRGAVERLLRRTDERLAQSLSPADLEGFFNTAGIMDKLP